MFVQYKRNLQASRFATSTEAATELPPDFSEQSPVARMQKLEQRLASSSHQHSVPGSSTSSLCTLMKVDVFVFGPRRRLHFVLELESAGPHKTFADIKSEVLEKLGESADVVLMISPEPNMELDDSCTLGECGWPKQLRAIVSI